LTGSSWSRAEEASRWYASSSLMMRLVDMEVLGDGDGVDGCFWCSMASPACLRDQHRVGRSEGDGIWSSKDNLHT
jgi:hypothetical protein